MNKKTITWLEVGYLLAGTLLAFVLSYLVFGFYYERNDAQYALAYGEGFFDTQPLTDIFIYHFFINRIYVALTKMLPAVDWYGVFMIAYSFIGVSLILLAVMRALKPLPFKGWQRVGILGAIYVLFLLDQVIQVQSLRVPFLLSFGVVLNLLLWDGKKGKKQLLVYALLAVVFLVAVAIKYEAPALVLLFISGIYFLYHHSFTRFQHTFRNYAMLFFPLVLLTGGLLYAMVNYSEQNRNCWSMLQSAYTYEDAGYQLEAQFDTPRDSMIHAAFKAGFRTDLDHFSTDYFSQQTKPMFHLLEFFVNENFVQKYWSVFTHFMSSLKHQARYVFFAYCLLAFFIWHFSQYRFNTGQLVRYLLFHVWFWGCFLSLEFFLVLPKHIASPMLGLYGILNVLFLVKWVAESQEVEESEKTHKLQRNAGISLLLIAPLLAWQLWLSQMVVADEYRYTESVMTEIHHEINHHFQDKIMVLNTTSVPLVHTRPLQKKDMAYHNSYFCYDGLVIMLDAYKALIKREIGSEKFEAYFDYLYQNRDKVVFISDKTRLKLFEDYLRIVYQKDYRFKRMNVDDTALNKFGDNYLKTRKYRYSIAVEKNRERDNALFYYEFATDE